MKTPQVEAMEGMTPLGITDNSHDSLLEVAKRAEKFISEVFPNLRGTQFNILGELRDAIAKAEGK